MTPVSLLGDLGRHFPAQREDCATFTVAQVTPLPDFLFECFLLLLVWFFFPSLMSMCVGWVISSSIEPCWWMCYVYMGLAYVNHQLSIWLGAGVEEWRHEGTCAFFLFVCFCLGSGCNHNVSRRDMSAWNSPCSKRRGTFLYTYIYEDPVSGECILSVFPLISLVSLRSLQRDVAPFMVYLDGVVVCSTWYWEMVSWTFPLMRLACKFWGWKYWNCRSFELSGWGSVVWGAIEGQMLLSLLLLFISFHTHLWFMHFEVCLRISFCLRYVIELVLGFLGYLL